MGLLRNLFDDLYQGGENGYRKCCVAFYSLVFHPVSELFPRLKESYARWLWWQLPGDWAPYNVQYIPCPLCMLRRSFDKTQNPFSTERVPDVTLEDYEELMSDHLMFMDEEPF